jgi:hydrogenase nickel incorporation protein HypA/HybF
MGPAMHEMSLCEAVVDLVLEEARKAGAIRIKAVVLDVGVLGHVDADALAFCYEAVARGTLAENARLVINAVAGAGWCLDCAKTVALSERFGACPVCGRHHVQMTSGDELRLRELEVE